MNKLITIIISTLCSHGFSDKLHMPVHICCCLRTTNDPGTSAQLSDLGVLVCAVSWPARHKILIWSVIGADWAS